MERVSPVNTPVPPRAVFLLQIISAEWPHQVVRLPAGGVLERDLTRVIAAQILDHGLKEALVQDIADACVARILSKGVGFWRTEEHVRRAIIHGIQEAFDDLPNFRGQVTAATESGIRDAIRALKVETVQAI